MVISLSKCHSPCGAESLVPTAASWLTNLTISKVLKSKKDVGNDKRLQPTESEKSKNRRRVATPDFKRPIPLSTRATIEKVQSSLRDSDARVAQTMG